MKRTVPWIVLILMYIVAFVVNVGSFAWSYDVGWLEFLASVFYASAWMFFFGTGRHEQNKMRFSSIVGAVTMVGGVLGVLVRTFPSARLTLPALLTAGLTVTPLYGLLGLIGDFDIFYLAAALLGSVWLGISLLQWKRSGSI